MFFEIVKVCNTIWGIEKINFLVGTSQWERFLYLNYLSAYCFVHVLYVQRNGLSLKQIIFKFATVSNYKNTVSTNPECESM